LVSNFWVQELHAAFGTLHFSRDGNAEPGMQCKLTPALAGRERGS
jgi:hypothetical protein